MPYQNHSNVLNLTRAIAEKEARRRRDTAFRTECLVMALDAVCEAQRGQLPEDLILVALTIVTQRRAQNDLQEKTKGRALSRREAVCSK